MKPPNLYITHGEHSHVIGANQDPNHDDALVVASSLRPTPSIGWADDVVWKEAVTKLEPGDSLTYTYKLEYFLTSTVTVEKGDTPHSLDERARETRIDQDPVVAIRDCNVYHESIVPEKSQA